ncbi:hypothetical protein [Vibrio mediterranei]|uniref:hypothetical protein n=1 Tax=Vibrio mediterranei TaxID=689 RepID=UPI004068166F
MDIVLVSISKHGQDVGLLLNGHVIATADPEAKDPMGAPAAVGINLARALGSKMRYANHEPKHEEWNWDEVSLCFSESMKRCVGCKRALFNDAYCDNDGCFYKDWPQEAVAHQGVEQSVYEKESGYLKRIEICAKAVTDDGRIEVEFDASPYFIHAMNNEELANVLAKLRACDFQTDYAADAVAEFFEASRTRPVFEHVGGDIGFECFIEESDVLSWLEKFAPEHLQGDVK